MKNQGIPPQFARVVIDGKVRLVPVSGNRVYISRQRTGEVLGHTASVGVIPFELLWAAMKGIGTLVAESPEGQGAQYGYYQGQRNKSVIMTTRATVSSNDEMAIRQQAQALPGITAEQALNLPVKALAKALADARVEDRYIDEQSYVAEYPQIIIEGEENPGAVFGVPAARQHPAMA